MSAWLAGLGIGQGLLNVWMNERNNQANMKLAEYKFQRDKEMMHLQNQFNSPAEQMKRLEAAGLNPMLVYGGGNVTGNQGAASPQYSAPRLNASEFPDMLGSYVAAKTQQVNNDFTRAQIRNVEATTLNTLANNPAIKADVTIKEAIARNAAELSKTQLETQSLTNEKMRADMAAQALDNKMKEFEIKLNQQGLTKADALYFRQMTQAAIELGVPPADIYKKLGSSPLGKLLQSVLD